MGEGEEREKSCPRVGGRKSKGVQEVLAEPKKIDERLELSYSNQSFSVLKWTGREGCEKGKVRAFVDVFCRFSNH